MMTRSAAAALLAALLPFCQAAAEEPLESDFFFDTIDTVTGSVDVVDDFGADGSDNADDSQAVQDAIDAMHALPGGGRVFIPSGRYLLANIRVRSNVHVEIDAGAVLVPTPELPSNRNRSMFWLGGERNDATILERAQSCSIRGVGGRWTADLTALAVNRNYSVVRCFNTRNFLVADLNCIDNFTHISAIVLTVGEFDNQFFQPRDGVVRNCTQTDGHPGFGLVQMQVGVNIFYKNLSGGRGVTLRMESGAARGNHNFNIDRVFARDISNTEGSAAMTLNPHARFNGSVDARRISSVSSRFTIYTVPGFDDTPGRFGNVIIRDVHAEYGVEAPSAERFHRFIPCDLRHLIRDDMTPEGIHFLTPSAVAVLHTASDGGNNGQGEYLIDFQNVTQDGFDHQPKAIITDADAVRNCPPPPAAATTNAAEPDQFAPTPAAAEVADEPNTPPAFRKRRYNLWGARRGRAFATTIANRAADPDRDPLTFRKVSGREWLSVSPDGKLSGKPAPSDRGYNYFRIEVSDGRGGTHSAKFRILVR